MGASLGIFVCSDKHLEKVVKLCRAAEKKGIEVRLFFSHEGILLTQSPEFGKLEGFNMFVCKVGFESHSLRPPIPGIGEKDFLTQAVNAELIDDCDRYVVF